MEDDSVLAGVRGYDEEAVLFTDGGGADGVVTGFEIGSGIYINSLCPEEAAERLRAAGDRRLAAVYARAGSDDARRAFCRKTNHSRMQRELRREADGIEHIEFSKYAARTSPSAGTFTSGPLRRRAGPAAPSKGQDGQMPPGASGGIGDLQLGESGVLILPAS